MGKNEFTNNLSIVFQITHRQVEKQES